MCSNRQKKLILFMLRSRLPGEVICHLWTGPCQPRRLQLPYPVKACICLRCRLPLARLGARKTCSELSPCATQLREDSGAMTPLLLLGMGNAACQVDSWDKFLEGNRRTAPSWKLSLSPKQDLFHFTHSKAQVHTDEKRAPNLPKPNFIKQALQSLTQSSSFTFLVKWYVYWAS